VATPLKGLIDRTMIEDVGARVAAESPGFDTTAFVDALDPVLVDLELKARIEAIARHLRLGLVGDYRSALATVVAVARAEPPIEGFGAWALCTFVELYGVDEPEVSLPAMATLTRRASCEFAIRPFLDEHWDAAYAQLLAFTGSPDETVRRLPSEGTRPRLPWGRGVRRLIDDPEPGLALLERLRHDPSATVRRSVANHLNDVAKDHPEVVVAVARRWTSETPPVERSLLSHGLRTLVKQGHPAALDVLGFTTETAVEISEFTVRPDVVRMGEHIELEASLLSTGSSPQRLMVDFLIHHVNATGRHGRPKVFKWTTVELAPGERVTIHKRRLIRQASTRTLHDGPHRVELQVAGRVGAATVFMLET